MIDWKWVLQCIGVYLGPIAMALVVKFLAIIILRKRERRADRRRRQAAQAALDQRRRAYADALRRVEDPEGSYRMASPCDLVPDPPSPTCNHYWRWPVAGGMQCSYCGSVSPIEPRASWDDRPRPGAGKDGIER